MINDAQWKMLEARLPKPKPKPKGGMPSADNHQVLVGILLVFRAGAKWQGLQDRYASP